MPPAKKKKRSAAANKCRSSTTKKTPRKTSCSVSKSSTENLNQLVKCETTGGSTKQSIVPIATSKNKKRRQGPEETNKGSRRIHQTVMGYPRTRSSTLALLQQAGSNPSPETPRPIQRLRLYLHPREPDYGENHTKLQPVAYRGTMIMPLASFGEFEVKPETKELPWISDHTSGPVHPDMHTISMLFNDNLTLPEAAESFLQQAAALQEEARWERTKAAFYSLYPEILKSKVFEVLSQKLRRDASRIIAMKTLRFENEILLISIPNNTASCVEPDFESEADLHAEHEHCSEEDATKINELLPEIARDCKENIALTLKDFAIAAEKLSKHNSFSTFGRVPLSAVKEQSKLWIEDLKKYQEATRVCVETRLLCHHLDNAVARYDPRTEWIHVKTQLLRSALEENKTLPKEIFDVKLHAKYKIQGSVEAQRAAVDKQMALFEEGLRNLRRGHLDNLDFHHNIVLCHEYEVRVSYANIAPAMCKTVVETLLPHLGWNYFCIVSKPHLLPYEKLHHVLKVYIDLHKGKVPYSGNTTFDTTIQYKDRYGCCLNCFSKDHVRVNCEEPVYDFANLVKVKESV